MTEINLFIFKNRNKTHQNETKKNMPIFTITLETMGTLPEPELFAFFQKYANAVRQLTEGTSEEQGILYGNYKQVTVGDNTTERPWFVNVFGCQKWDAWTACQGKTKLQAMMDYIATADRLYTEQVGALFIEENK